MNAPNRFLGDQTPAGHYFKKRHGITLPKWMDYDSQPHDFESGGENFQYLALGSVNGSRSVIAVVRDDAERDSEILCYPEHERHRISIEQQASSNGSGTERHVEATYTPQRGAPAPALRNVQIDRKNAPPPPKSRSERCYDLRTADDLAALPPAPYRVKNVLLREALAAIFGPSGSGKSFAAIDLAFTVSDGRDWFGYRVEPCDVLYVGLEGEAGLAQRVKAYRKRNGAGAGKRVKFIASPFSLLYPDDVDALVSTVKDAGIRDGVIIVDTLNAATPGMDENTSADMGKAIAAVKRIREECGGLVVLLHHPGKDVAKGLRGHSSLHAALDAVIEVSRDGDRRMWKLAKSKDGADGEEHQFRLDVVEVGIDEDGDAITSCVVVPEEIAADTVRRAKLPAGGHQRLIWDALGGLFRDSQVFGRGGAPAFRPCVELEAAIEKLRDRLATEPKRRTERTREAITGLLNRGLLKLTEGWLWIA